MDVRVESFARSRVGNLEEMTGMRGSRKAIVRQSADRTRLRLSRTARMTIERSEVWESVGTSSQRTTWAQEYA